MKKQTLLAIGVASIAATATPLALATIPLLQCDINDPTIFKKSGPTLTLQQNCTTDKTIIIPNGFRLNGNSKTITAVDPPGGGHFLGPVVKNGGMSAQVYKLIIDTYDLKDECDTGDDRLRGILFDGASGVITQNTILNITQGKNSLCNGFDNPAEGNGIEVRNPPFDGTYPNTKTVTVKSNLVRNYQKTGIVINGDVRAMVLENTVLGPDPDSTTTANGIQIGFGAFGVVRSNTITSAIFFPFTINSPLPPTAAAGVLAMGAGNSTYILQNQISESDVGIWYILTSHGLLKSNNITGPSVVDSPRVGLALDDFDQGFVEHNQVVGNRVVANNIGIALYGTGTSWNSVISNTTKENDTAGIFAGLGAKKNTFTGNISSSNDGDGVSIIGDDNLIQRGAYDGNGGNGLVVEGLRNEVSGNFARNNVGDGVNILGDDNVIQRGQYYRNGGNGLDVAGQGNWVSGNVALTNALDILNVGANAYTSNRCNTSSGPPVDCGIMSKMSLRRAAALAAKRLSSTAANSSTTTMHLVPAPFEY